MNRPDSELRLELGAFLDGRVCIVGVGNRARGDDGAGPRVIDARRRGTGGVWIDTGMAPENFLEPIVRTDPAVILIVDAVDFGGAPGQCRLIDATALDTVAVSTHAGSLAVLGKYLTTRTDARLQVLAIQPERIDARDELSPRVDESVRALAAMLSDLLVSATYPNDKARLPEWPSERNPLGRTNAT